MNLLRPTMTFGWFAVWAIVILVGSPTYAQRSSDLKPPLNVFLLAGQSNMAGADSEVAVPPGFQQTTADRDTLFTTAPLPDGDRSKQYVPWGEIRGHESKGKLVHGPEVGFARTLHAAGWRNLAIIKVHANFGRDVQDWPWSERGALFNDWTTFADARIAELVARGHTIRVRGFLWHQGIDDAIHGRLAGHYERNLTDLISVLRKRYADEHAPFLLARSVNSRIAQPNPNAGDDSPMAVVRRSQVKVGTSVPFAAWIDVDDLPNVNTHHFSADSQLVIGKRFGAAFLKFQERAVELSPVSGLVRSDEPVAPSIDQQPLFKAGEDGYFNSSRWIFRPGSYRRPSSPLSVRDMAIVQGVWRESNKPRAREVQRRMAVGRNGHDCSSGQKTPSTRNDARTVAVKTPDAPHRIVRFSAVSIRDAAQ